MAHLLHLIVKAAAYPMLLASAWLWERTSRRYLAVRPGKLAYTVRLLLFWTGSAGPLWIGDENLLFFFLAYMLGFFLCYQGTRVARAVVGTVFFLFIASIGMIFDTISVLLPMRMWDFSIGLGQLCKLLVAAGVFLLSRKLNPEENALQLPQRLWWLCALLSLAPLAVVLSFSLWHSFGRDSMDIGQYRIAYTVLPFMFLSAVALLVALTVLSHHEKLEQTAQLAQLRELYYKGTQEKETQVRTLRHDLRNHLAAVQGLLAEGDTQKAQAYLAGLTASPALHGTRRICENELANVVLCGKIAEMEAQGLTVDALVTLPERVPVADIDLCALLGNALDNAAEAAAQAEDKRVTLRLRADRGMLMLRVENSFAAAPTLHSGDFATTKADADAHGFGIRGMREIASRYGGTLEAAVNANRFELIACLPFSGDSAKTVST